MTATLEELNAAHRTLNLLVEELDAAGASTNADILRIAQKIVARQVYLRSHGAAHLPIATLKAMADPNHPQHHLLGTPSV